VVVHFDAAQIDIATLVEIHLGTHSATKPFVPKGKYRTAVYSFDDAQGSTLQTAISSLGGSFEKPLTTEVLPFRDFKPSDARYQNYYATDPERPFCKTYIDPKLAYIRKNFAKVALPTPAADGNAPPTA
jgi:peptide-methionine (S)-S-oxide reductase